MRLPSFSHSLPPDPLHSLVVHVPALVSQHSRDPRGPVPAEHRCQLDDPARQRSLVVAHTRRVALHCPQLAEHAACAALAPLRKRPLDFLDVSPAARRAQKFPLAASRRIALSSSA
jgi:hypothetical protein